MVAASPSRVRVLDEGSDNYCKAVSLIRNYRLKRRRSLDYLLVCYLFCCLISKCSSAVLAFPHRAIYWIACSDIRAEAFDRGELSRY